MPGCLATISLLVAVLEALLEGRRVDDVGEAVAVTILQVFEVEAVCFANVRQGEGDDLFAENVLDWTLNFAGHAKQPFRVEALQPRVRPLGGEGLGDLAVAVDVTGTLVGLVENQVLQEAYKLAALVFAQGGVSLARRERLAAVAAYHCVEIQTGAVMSVGRSRADSPERWRAPLADHAAVKLHLVEIRSNVVVLEVAVDTAHRV